MGAWANIVDSALAHFSPFRFSSLSLSLSSQESQIIRDCHDVIKESNSLKRCLSIISSSPGRRLNARDNLREVVETLEQTVNNALLKLIIEGTYVRRLNEFH